VLFTPTRIRTELQEALQEIDLSSISPYASEEEQLMTDVGLNTILYGPPGTGKTYHTVIYAVAIIENRELASVEAESYRDVLARYNEIKRRAVLSSPPSISLSDMRSS